MRNLLLSIPFLACSIVCMASSPLSVKDTKDDKAKATFHKHSGEFHLTPSADYFFHRNGSMHETPSPYEFHMPFIGFDLGGQYMYRPCELFGVSTGLGFRMQGDYYRHTNYFLGNKYVDYLQAGHTGYLQMPIEFHLFKQMEHSTFEFATGPQFNFPVFEMHSSTAFSPNGDKLASNKDKTNFTTKQMGDDAVLGWNILLGADLDLCEYSDLFIGPQINFLNIASFDKDVNKAGRENGRYYDCSLGLKLGFRFHCKQ